MDRQEHIEGLQINQLNPVDIDYFFRSLADRMPRRANDEQQPLLDGLRQRIRDLALDLGNTKAKRLHADDTEGACALMVAQIGQMRRRQWRDRIDGVKKIDHVRAQVGEISADLRELTS
ncbi:MAG: hypothetical protein ACI8Y4_005620 [Candidatus Poriferisodalaceae bacterium]|jgi:hypothetical protein